MESNAVTDALAALGQPMRYRAMKLLTEAPDGIAAGELARMVGIAPNTLSFHIGILARAGLVTSERQGRSIAYRADPEAIARLEAGLHSDFAENK